MRDIKNRASGTGETITKDPTFKTYLSQKGKIKEEGPQKENSVRKFPKFGKKYNSLYILKSRWR